MLGPADLLVGSVSHSEMNTRHSLGRPARETTTGMIEPHPRAFKHVCRRCAERMAGREGGRFCDGLVFYNENAATLEIHLPPGRCTSARCIKTRPHSRYTCLCRCTGRALPAAVHMERYGAPAKSKALDDKTRGTAAVVKKMVIDGQEDGV